MENGESTRFIQIICSHIQGDLKHFKSASSQDSRIGQKRLLLKRTTSQANSQPMCNSWKFWDVSPSRRSQNVSLQWRLAHYGNAARLGAPNGPCSTGTVKSGLTHRWCSMTIFLCPQFWPISWIYIFMNSKAVWRFSVNDTVSKAQSHGILISQEYPPWGIFRIWGTRIFEVSQLPLITKQHLIY